VKNHSLLLIPLLLAAAILAFADRAYAAVDCNVDYCVGGTISTNQTWATTTAVYVVQSGITIDSGVTLTINPGVVVKFQSATAIFANGTLYAVGSSSAPIIFTSIDDDYSDGRDTSGNGTTLPRRVFGTGS
jgi:hypothetical protein